MHSKAIVSYFTGILACQLVRLFFFQAENFIGPSKTWGIILQQCVASPLFSRWTFLRPSVCQVWWWCLQGFKSPRFAISIYPTFVLCMFILRWFIWSLQSVKLRMFIGPSIAHTGWWLYWNRNYAILITFLIVFVATLYMDYISTFAI